MRNMVDPITVLGTAGAVANIIEVLSKIITTLHEIHQQWKDADFTFLSLVAQLIALRAALTKIKEWADGEVTEHDYQLAMDLDVTVACCRLLVGKIDAQASDLQSKPTGLLTASSRVKLIFGSGKGEALQRMIERQTNALTLLLTACNWYVYRASS